jgi:hypothetical protein
MSRANLRVDAAFPNWNAVVDRHTADPNSPEQRNKYSEFGQFGM